MSVALSGSSKRGSSIPKLDAQSTANLQAYRMRQMLDKEKLEAFRAAKKAKKDAERRQLAEQFPNLFAKDNDKEIRKAALAAKVTKRMSSTTLGSAKKAPNSARKNASLLSTPSRRKLYSMENDENVENLQPESSKTNLKSAKKLKQQDAKKPRIASDNFVGLHGSLTAVPSSHGQPATRPLQEQVQDNHESVGELSSPMQIPQNHVPSFCLQPTEADAGGTETQPQQPELVAASERDGDEDEEKEAKEQESPPEEEAVLEVILAQKDQGEGQDNQLQDLLDFMLENKEVDESVHKRLSRESLSAKTLRRLSAGAMSIGSISSASRAGSFGSMVNNPGSVIPEGDDFDIDNDVMEQLLGLGLCSEQGNGLDFEAIDSAAGITRNSLGEAASIVQQGQEKEEEVVDDMEALAALRTVVGFVNKLTAGSAETAGALTTSVSSGAALSTSMPLDHQQREGDHQDDISVLSCEEPSEATVSCATHDALSSTAALSNAPVDGTAGTVPFVPIPSASSATGDESDARSTLSASESAAAAYNAHVSIKTNYGDTTDMALIILSSVNQELELLESGAVVEQPQNRLLADQEAQMEEREEEKEKIAECTRLTFCDVEPSVCGTALTNATAKGTKKRRKVTITPFSDQMDEAFRRGLVAGDIVGRVVREDHIKFVIQIQVLHVPTNGPVLSPVLSHTDAQVLSKTRILLLKRYSEFKLLHRDLSNAIDAANDRAIAARERQQEEEKGEMEMEGAREEGERGTGFDLAGSLEFAGAEQHQQGRGSVDSLGEGSRRSSVSTVMAGLFSMLGNNNNGNNNNKNRDGSVDGEKDVANGDIVEEYKEKGTGRESMESVRLNSRRFVLSEQIPPLPSKQIISLGNRWQKDSFLDTRQAYLQNWLACVLTRQSVESDEFRLRLKTFLSE